MTMNDKKFDSLIAQEANRIFLKAYDIDCLPYDGYDGAYIRYWKLCQMLKRSSLNNLEYIYLF